MAIESGVMKLVKQTMVIFAVPMFAAACGSTSDPSTTSPDSLTTITPPAGGSNVNVNIVGGRLITTRCGNIDFDLDGDANTLNAGENLANAYESWGVSISARDRNNTTVGRAIVFDSSNPTGGDFDLGTPNMSYGGPGIGSGGWSNDSSLFGLMIKAENTIDNNGDGLVDDPDDDARGGWLNFDFAEDMCVMVASVLDVEQNEVPARLLLKDGSGALVAEHWAAGYGNNSVQNVPMGNCGVRELKVGLRGSGAVDAVKICTGVPGNVDVTLSENLDNVKDIEFDVQVMGEDAAGNLVPFATSHFKQYPFMLNNDGILPDSPLVSQNPAPGQYDRMQIRLGNIEVVRFDGTRFSYPPTTWQAINEPVNVPACGGVDVDIEYEINVRMAMNLQELAVGLAVVAANTASSTSGCGGN